MNSFDLILNDIFSALCSVAPMLVGAVIIFLGMNYTVERLTPFTPELDTYELYDDTQRMGDNCYAIVEQGQITDWRCDE